MGEGVCTPSSSVLSASPDASLLFNVMRPADGLTGVAGCRTRAESKRLICRVGVATKGVLRIGTWSFPDHLVTVEVEGSSPPSLGFRRSSFRSFSSTDGKSFVRPGAS